MNSPVGPDGECRFVKRVFWFTSVCAEGAIFVSSPFRLRGASSLFNPTSPSSLFPLSPLLHHSYTKETVRFSLIFQRFNGLPVCPSSSSAATPVCSPSLGIMFSLTVVLHVNLRRGGGAVPFLIDRHLEKWQLSMHLKKLQKKLQQNSEFMWKVIRDEEVTPNSVTVKKLI